MRFLVSHGRPENIFLRSTFSKHTGHVSCRKTEAAQQTSLKVKCQPSAFEAADTFVTRNSTLLESYELLPR